MNKQVTTLKTRTRYMLAFFMVSLVLSGLTAIPVEEQLTIFLGHFPANNDLSRFFNEVYNGMHQTNINYPFIRYGFDWLAFAHVVIAITFIGALKDPVRNKWVIESGIIMCVLVIPFALTFGAMRGLPFWWRLIDCSFGIIGILPLWYCHRNITKMEKLIAADKQNVVF